MRGCCVADAKQVEPCPGARSGIRLIRGGWLRAFLRGAVTSCFVAIPECRVIRLHIRYRRDRTEERTREK